MALINRQKFLYKYVCDIWKQIDPPIDSEFTQTGFPPVLSDYGTYALSASGLSCLYWSTPELAEITAVGRTKLVFLQTLDKWKFTADVDIADTDIIVCTFGPNNFAFTGYAWAVQGNTQTETTISLINSQLVYGKIINNPNQVPGIGNHYGIY